MPKKGNTRKKQVNNGRRLITRRGGYRQAIRGQGGFLSDAGSMLANALVPGSGPLVKTGMGLLGLGAYGNPVKNTILASAVPAMHTLGPDNGVRITHKEYLGTITSSTDYEVASFRMNPGDAVTFPWLSNIARNFQKYRIEGLCMYFKSTSSVAIASSTNLALGTIMGGFMYDVGGQPPSTMADMLALSGVEQSRPSEDAIYGMECDPKKIGHETLLITEGAIPSGADPQEYDCSKFIVATDASQGVYPVGQIWITYDVVLMSPKRADPAAADIWPAAAFQAQAYTPSVAMNLFPVAETDPKPTPSQLGFKLSGMQSTGAALVVPPHLDGYFLLRWVWSGLAASTLKALTIDQTHTDGSWVKTCDEVATSNMVSDPSVPRAVYALIQVRTFDQPFVIPERFVPISGTGTAVLQEFSVVRYRKVYSALHPEPAVARARLAMRTNVERLVRDGEAAAVAVGSDPDLSAEVSSLTMEDPVLKLVRLKTPAT